MALKAPFRKCVKCRSKLPPADGHSVCLVCLGESHITESCAHCMSFSKQTRKNRSDRLKAILWKNALLAVDNPNMATEKATTSTTQTESVDLSATLHNKSQKKLKDKHLTEKARAKKRKPELSRHYSKKAKRPEVAHTSPMPIFSLQRPSTPSLPLQTNNPSTPTPSTSIVRHGTEQGSRHGSTPQRQAVSTPAHTHRSVSPHDTVPPTARRRRPNTASLSEGEIQDSSSPRPIIVIDLPEQPSPLRLLYRPNPSTVSNRSGHGSFYSNPRSPVRDRSWNRSSAWSLPSSQQQGLQDSYHDSEYTRRDQTQFSTPRRLLSATVSILPEQPPPVPHCGISLLNPTTLQQGHKPSAIASIAPSFEDRPLPLPPRDDDDHISAYSKSDDDYRSDTTSVSSIPPSIPSPTDVVETPEGSSPSQDTFHFTDQKDGSITGYPVTTT